MPAALEPDSAQNGIELGQRCFERYRQVQPVLRRVAAFDKDVKKGLATPLAAASGLGRHFRSRASGEMPAESGFAKRGAAEAAISR
jgi:hypothetical protein